MSGRVVASKTVTFTVAGTQAVSIPLTEAQRAALAADGSMLVSYVSAQNTVQAFDLPLAAAHVSFTATHGSSEGPGGTSRPIAELRVRLTGTAPFPGAPTGSVQFRVDGADVGSPVALDEDGRAALDVPDFPFNGHTLTAVYSGDGDYAASSVTLTPVDPGPGPAGPPGPVGPRGPRGPAGKTITVACKVVKKDRIRCSIHELRGTNRSARLRVRVHVAGATRTAAASGRGRVEVTLRPASRPRRSARVVVTVRRAGKSATLTVRANGAIAKAIGRL